MRRVIRMAAAGLIGAMVLGAAPAALASRGSGSSGGGDAIENSGPCSGASRWKLKVKPDNGLLEVEFEVDSNVVGQVWNVTMKDNGTRFFRGQRTTQAPSGSFEARKRTTNQAGTDTIQARAKNPSTGEI